MKRRRWKPEQKALIVLEGLRGRLIGELCAEHEISQAQHYQCATSSSPTPRKHRAGRRPTTPGLTEEELAFYDVLGDNKSAREVMQDALSR